MQIESLEDRTVPAGISLASALPIDPTGLIADAISAPGETDWFRFTVEETGRISVHTDAELDTRLSLLGPDGQLMVQSDGISGTNPDDQIVQHLTPGTYFLQVEGLGGGTGSYTLTTEFLPAVPPFQSLPVGSSGEFTDLVTADFNNDGFSDLVRVSPQASYVSVYLGLGDGTFRQQLRFDVDALRLSLAAGDFNRDGRLDLAVGNRLEPFVEVFLGRGDGTFGEAARFAVGVEGDSVVTTDFNGDGFLDLAVANHVSNDISMLLGRGDGTFRDQVRIPMAGGPIWLFVADFNRDGRADLVSANFDTDDVAILLGRGDGTFQNERRFQVGDGPFGGDVGDLNGDGFLDLVVTNDGTEADMSVLLGRGDGTFEEEQRVAVRGAAESVKGAPESVKARDFNGDGRLDLAVANVIDLSVFLGRGDGTFTDPVRYGVGLIPRDVVASDFNGDGHLDLANTNSASFDLTIRFGRGDGTFSSQGRVADFPTAWTSATGDFNGDGRIDLATTNTNFDAVAVSLGRGDGTFQPPVLFATNPNPRGITTGDFNGDGRLDLATTSSRTSDVMILLGLGDGTFQPGRTFQLDLAQSRQADIRSADFNGDGRLDLAVANQNASTVCVLLGRGDGTFDDRVSYTVGTVRDLIPGDFDGDGHPDLVTGDFEASELVVLLGRGDGTFHTPARFAVAHAPVYFAAADFNGDGRLDLATTSGKFHFSFDDPRGGELSVHLGRRDGTFEEPVLVASGNSPLTPVAGDFNGDGRQDLAFNNFDRGEFCVVLGRGDGTFDAPVRYEVGDLPFGPFPGDFNGDGRDDFAFRIRGTARVPAQAEVVLLGVGDGTFGAPLRSAFNTNLTSTSLAADDLNNDGRLDVVTSLIRSDRAAIFLGQGDGTFQDAPPSVTGTAPVSVQTGDFNGDSRLDLATANYLSGDVTVALGLGDGTYRDAVRFAVGTRPVSLVLGDFNGDGRLDLATANSGSHDVSVLLGLGAGTFRSEVRLAVGTVPLFLLAADVNGDGRLDLATANYVSGDVSLLLGRGDGTFRPELRVAAGTAPVALGVGDFNRDGRSDLAIAHLTSDEVTVLLGRVDGTYQDSGRFAVGRLPRSLAVDDFNGDGFLDLAAANNNSDDVSVLLGRGDGTFQDQVRYAVEKYPFAIVAADFNGDGRVDLGTANQLGAETSILLGLGDGTFVTPDTLSTAVRSTPVIADLNGDGAVDVAIIDRKGDILLRLGRLDSPGSFAAPLVLNANLGAARDLALVRTDAGPLLAALGARSSSVSFYVRGVDGAFAQVGSLAVAGTLPGRLTAGDLDGDGRDDLAVLTAGSKELLVYIQRMGLDSTVPFAAVPDFRLPVGTISSDIALADVDGDGRRDIVVTDQFSGDVRVLRNDPAAPFASELRFRAGTGLYYVESRDAAATVRSREGTTGLVVGQFNADSVPDLLVTNGLANSIALLIGSGNGGYLNPQRDLTFATGLSPTLVVVGYFNVDAHLDVAVLNEGSADVSVFLGDGQGGFIAQAPLAAGNAPTGLSVHDVNADGRLDLVVGNEFGDVLALLGNGDGTFQPYQRAGRDVALAVADVNNDGLDDYIFANEARDRVSVDYSGVARSFSQERDDGLLAPGAVSTADLNGDTWTDLVIANSGANNVLVYLGAGNGQFATARSFFAGTNPAGLTAQDLNGDGLLDLVVANEGSNDVTILLGQGQGIDWTFTPGPRLSAGAAPVSTVVQDVTGDNIADILVTNRQSNDVYLLPGVGNGFFNDQDPIRFTTGLAPAQALVGNFDGLAGLDLVSINAGSNNLTFFSNFTAPSSVGVSIISGGIAPVAAVGGDFNADGLADLLVAHNGDGAISLLLGEETGLGLTTIRSLADLHHPTALALGTNDGPGLEVLLVGEDSEVVSRLTFEFGPIALPPGDSFFSDNSARRQVTDVLPLQDSSVAIVATLLTVRLDTEALTAQAENSPRTANEDATFLDSVFALLDAAAPGGCQEENEDNAPVAEEQEVHSERVDALFQFLTGNQEALEQRAPLSREDVLGPSQQPPVIGEGPMALMKDLNEIWQVLRDSSSEALGASMTILQSLLESVTNEKVAPPDLPMHEPDDRPNLEPEGEPSSTQPLTDDSSVPQPPNNEARPFDECERTSSPLLLMALFTSGVIHFSSARRCRRRPTIAAAGH